MDEAEKPKKPKRAKKATASGKAPAKKRSGKPTVDDSNIGDVQIYGLDRCWTCRNPRNVRDWRCWMPLEKGPGSCRCNTCKERSLTCDWSEEAKAVRLKARRKRRAALKAAQEAAEAAEEAANATAGPSSNNEAIETSQMLARMSGTLERLLEVAEEILFEIRDADSDDEEAGSDRLEVSSLSDSSSTVQNDPVEEEIEGEDTSIHQEPTTSGTEMGEGR
jgi:hypothetical protein